MRYALIKGAAVVTVVEQDDPPVPNGMFDIAVQTDGPASGGWTWDGVNLNPPVPRNLGKLISRIAFRNRLTDDEKINIELAALDIPNGQPAARRKQAKLRVLKEDVLSASKIDLSDARFIAAVNEMESEGLLGSGRAQAILTAPVREDELP